jgi:hypothetical protein
MELYDVVKFAHIAVLLFAIALSGAIHTSEWLVVRSTTVQQMRALARPQVWGILFAPVVGLLLLLGSWLVTLSDDRSATYSFSDGWVWTAMVVLVIAFVAGFGLEGPHAEGLNKALAEAPDGPATAELQALASARVPWLVGHAVTFAVIGVVCNMVNKPGAAVAVLVIVVAAILGALLATLGLRSARVTA